jgi:xanthine dehydrogenase accessory factor
MTLDLPRVMVAGAGELGSAVCHRLRRSGFEVVATDMAKPRCIRRRVCFAVALGSGSMEVEGVVAEEAMSPSEAEDILARGSIAVIAGEYRALVEVLGARVLVDATLRKGHSDKIAGLAPLTIGLGPGFVAGETCDIVIETNRGHDLGRIIRKGAAEPDTGVPGEIMGMSRERVVRAPAEGVFGAGIALGSLVDKGDVLGEIDGVTEVRAPISGVLRGLIVDGAAVQMGQKMGDVDPRGASIDVNTISDKGRAVAGGVLEAVVSWWVERCMNSN